MRRLVLAFGLMIVQALLVGQTGLVAMASAYPAGLLGFGQQHDYSVTMRGNGEAVVTARLVFTNTGDQPQKSFAFEIPKLAVRDLMGYQQHITTACLSYGPEVKTGTGSATTSASAAAGGSSAGTTIPTVPSVSPGVQPAILQRPCLEYATPDYSQDIYGNNGSTYAKLTFKSTGNGKYEVDLPTAVGAQESSALLIGYSGKGYATSRFGAYNFDFQTIKVAERIKSATVAVDVDSDLYLLGGKSKVNYNQGTAKSTDLSSGANAAAPSSQQLDSIAYGLGQNGQIVKETSGLAAGESFSVRGAYADAAWKLHPWRLAALALLGLGLLALAVWLVRRARRAMAVKPGDDGVHVREPHDAGLVLPDKGVVDQEVTSHDKSTVSWPAFFDPAFIIAGLVTAVAIGLLTWLVTYNSAQPTVTVDEFTNVISGIVIVLGYVLAVAGPVVWLALRRRDVRAGLYVFVWQIAWLVALLLVYQFGIRPFFNTGSDPGTIYPMMDGGAKAN